MKNLLFVSILFLLSCQNNENGESEVIVQNELANSEIEAAESEHEVTKLPIEWGSISMANFSFEVPNNWEFQSKLSSKNKKVFGDVEKYLGLTVDIAYLPEGTEESKIFELFPDLNDFGKSICDENKKSFKDFQLISTTKSKLGSKNSILVSQKSTQMSGKNIPIVVLAHFVLTNPYYATITFSYPEDMSSADESINKIRNSFKFDVPNKSIN